MAIKKNLLIVLAVFSTTSLLFIIDVQRIYAQSTTVYDVDGAVPVTISSSPTDTTVFRGMEITATSSLVGVTVNRMIIEIDKEGSPTDTITVAIWNSANAPTSSNYIHLIGTLSASGVSSSFTEHTFVFEDYNFTGIEALGVYYDNGGDGANHIQVKQAGDLFDSTNTRDTQYRRSSGWVDGTTADLDAELIFEGSTSDSACIDTNLDGITDLCFTDTNNDGIADNGQSGALGAFNSNANVTQMGTQWFCAFNIGGACENEDVKTNGVGIFYTLLIIVFSYALLVSIHIMAVRQLHKQHVQVMDMININPILLIIVLFLDVGFAWYLDFIADEIFYTAMVIPLGLSALGIFKVIRGR